MWFFVMLCRVVCAQRARFVAILVRSVFGSSRFQCTARVVRRFPRVGRTFRFDSVRSGSLQGDILVLFRLRRACGWLVSRGESKRENSIIKQIISK